jgi:amidohydrolase
MPARRKHDDPLYGEVLTAAENIGDELVILRREIHQFPELGWNESKTSEKISKKLAEAGLKSSNGLAGYGLYTDIGKKNGRMVAFRADMDALPIQDQKHVPYASKVPGCAHMCGHDVHTSIALGVAKVLSQFSDELQGQVRVLWQPAEETQPSGAPEMISAGILDGVGAIYGVHCDPNLPTGKLSMKRGAETAAFDSFMITVKSDSTTHSARPHLGTDTIWIANQIIQNLYQFIGRITDVLRPTTISICTFHAGEALNVIPNSVEFGGTIRTVSDDKREGIRTYVKSLIGSMQSLYDVQIDIRFGMGAPPVINDDRLFDHALQLINHQLGKNSFIDRDQSMGAEDFSFYTRIVPSLFVRVGSAGSPQTAYPLHSSLFDVDERMIAPTVAFMSWLLIRHLKDKPGK